MAPSGRLPATTFLVLAGVLCFGACAHPKPATITETTVVEVVDGDTVSLRFPTGAVETVRLLGIDTPETVDPSRPVQCFGAEASSRLQSLLPNGSAVRLERDTEARDHFGRLLAYVYRADDDLFINHDLVAHGMADVSFYEPNTTHQVAFEHALLTAQTQKTGLWGACGGADVALDPD